MPSLCINIVELKEIQLSLHRWTPSDNAMAMAHINHQLCVLALSTVHILGMENWQMDFLSCQYLDAAE